MAWVKTSFVFEGRHVMFTIPHRDVVRMLKEVPQSIAELWGVDHDELAALLEALVVTARPELAGCVIEAFDWSLVRSDWEMIVSHGSLPIVHDGEEIPKIPLLRNE